MPLRKVHELTFLWFGFAGATPEKSLPHEKRGKSDDADSKTQKMLGSVFGRTDFSRIFIFVPLDFCADFVAGFFLLIFVGKSAQKNPPRKSPAKSSKIYTTKIPDTFLQRGRAKRCGNCGWLALRRLSLVRCGPLKNLLSMAISVQKYRSSQNYYRQSCYSFGGFEQGLARGGGLATNKPPKRAPKTLSRNVSPFS